MSKMMKFKGVLDGFRSTQQAKPEEEITETLKPDYFQIAKTFLHGFPHQPTALAFDSIQKLLAIGTKTGSLRILGRAGVDTQVRHETEAAVIHIEFLTNEGALITATSDDSLHLWTFRQKKPEIVHSLKFQKERITCMHLPLKSKWLYVGSERGNVHVVNVESFALSGYVINWNKAIDVLRPTHPGPVVHLSDCPVDSNKLLIGYETGQIVFWNLRTKKADMRWQCTEPLRSISWHYEGKQFICGHTDGTLTTWNVRPQDKPSTVSAPHSKLNKDGKVDPPCKPIHKVEWRSLKSGECYTIFSGGTTYDNAGRIPSITVIHGKSTTVLEMEHNVVDFITLCDSPYASEIQEPYAIVVLLQNDLVLIDMQTNGYPCFENPYPMDIHESPVTSCLYIADCPSDIIPALYSVGVGVRASLKKTGFSEKEWPLSGGEWSPNSCSYNEIIVTGHADGSIKFWDASAGTLQILYKLKTSKLFEKPVSKESNEEEPFSVQLISLCPESRKLVIAGISSYVILLKFRKLEATGEVPVLEVPCVSGFGDVDQDSPEMECTPRSSITKETKTSLEMVCPLKAKLGPQKKSPGFQASLICMTAFTANEPAYQITSIALSSCYGLLAYGTEHGLVLVDFTQKCVLLNISSAELYGNCDPFQRAPRSPKRNTASGDASDGERCRSPSLDQCLDEEDMKMDIPSPPPDDVDIDIDVEAGEDALVLLSADDDEPSTTESVLVEPVEYKQQRRTSRSWKSFKTQFNKVDAKLKNTFRDGKKMTPVQNTELSPEESKSLGSGDECSSLPNIKEPQLEKDEKEENLSRPTDLPLDEKPVRPERKKDRKRFSLEKNHGRDYTTRLLSVPNIKYNSKETKKNQPFFGLIRRFNKLDNAVTRSRSSSMSSLENVASEPVQCLVFADSYVKRSECVAVPTLWIGTSVGSVFNITANIPTAGEGRLSQPVTISPIASSICRLKGGILSISFLDCNGSLLKYNTEQWKNDRERKATTKNNNWQDQSFSGSAENVSGNSGGQSDKQFLVAVSEKQARVVALPSTECVFKQQLADSDFVVKADIVVLRDSVCLVGYVSNSHIVAYTLPSLKLMVDVDFVPLSDLRIARTFCFSNKGHGLFFSSPSEVQKFTISAEFCRDMAEMVGELFLPKDMPEPPKQGLFKSLLGGVGKSVDREELFGESSGKPTRNIAKHIPGPSGQQLEQLKDRATVATGEVGKAHQLMVERGEKLGHLEERTQRMMTEAEKFSSSAHELVQKTKDKKWYQL